MDDIKFDACEVYSHFLVFFRLETVSHETYESSALGKNFSKCSQRLLKSIYSKILFCLKSQNVRKTPRIGITSFSIPIFVTKAQNSGGFKDDFEDDLDCTNHKENKEILEF